MKLRDLLNLTGLPILIASLCCLTPIILVLFGFSSLAFAISLTNLLEGQYQWLFIMIGVLTLSTSLTVYFRKRGVCTLDQVKRHRNEIINKVIISLLVAGIGYSIFFYIFLDYVGKLLMLWE